MAEPVRHSTMVPSLQNLASAHLADSDLIVKVAARMQFKLKSALVVLGVFLHPVFGSSAQQKPFTASGPRTLGQLIRFQIEQDFALRSQLSPRELSEVVASAIDRANPRHEGLPEGHALRLNRDLIQVSQCLGIDPVIFTALIWRESNFKPTSMSETGAVGLTQMTTTAIREVLERTHHQGTRKLKYARALFRKCAPSVFRNLPSEVTPQTVSRMKSIIAVSTLDGMVFGAFLLKLNLAGIRDGGTRLENYRIALERYNGDIRIKASFASDILTLTRRMLKAPAIASNGSRFLRQYPEL